MHCAALNCSALHCTVLWCSAMHSTLMQCITQEIGVSLVSPTLSCGCCLEPPTHQPAIRPTIYESIIKIEHANNNFSRGNSNVVRLIQIFSKAISYLFFSSSFFWEIVCYCANIVRKRPHLNKILHSRKSIKIISKFPNMQRRNILIILALDYFISTDLSLLSHLLFYWRMSNLFISVYL